MGLTYLDLRRIISKEFSLYPVQALSLAAIPLKERETAVDFRSSSIYLLLSEEKHVKYRRSKRFQFRF